MHPDRDPADEPTADPFLLDHDRIQALAQADLVREGLRHYREDRVTDLDASHERLWATVEDAETAEPVALRLVAEPDGSLRCECACAAPAGSPCVHAIAALFAWAGRSGGTPTLLGAAEGAIEERVKRGRTEVTVTPLSSEPGYGPWNARSIAPSSHFQTSYRVHIRSLARRANYCSCPDFATNQLGTCKHVEAVLHRIAKRRDYAQLKRQPPPAPFVYLDWESDPAPQVRLSRVGIDGPDPDLGRLLDEHFDDAGAYRRRLPEDFLRLADVLADRDDIDLGEDAIAYARRLAGQAAQRLRAREIGDQIRASGGRLPGVEARLYPYQVEGVAFLVARGRALLADDMGLGKTLQAIAAASWMIHHREAERVLVVCPASLKQQWAREIRRFTGRQAQVVGGPAAARTVQYRGGPGIYIANYELILRDADLVNESLCPDLLILDEAQRIKNWRTKIAASVKRIGSRHAFVLSGTPLENRLEDLYSLMQVVDPAVLGPLWRYLAEFHITDERGKVLGYRNLSELRRRLAPAMLRRDRTLVRDQLPERIESRLDIPLSREQQGLHDAALMGAAQIAAISRRRPLTPVEQNRLLAALQEARMACNAAGLVDKQTQGSPKLDELTGLLDDLCLQSGLKAVVFSQWEQMTRMVEERVRSMGLGCVRLHGGVPTDKRGTLIDRFREDPAVQVFISTDSGGVGLNLQSASVLINLDIPWNPAVLDQRIARVHRLGQQERVQILLLVAADSSEGRVLELVQGKRNLFDNVVDPGATEDVVGVSRKLVEVLAQDLATLPQGKPAEGQPVESAEAGNVTSAVPLEAGASGPAEATETEPRAEPTPIPDALPSEVEESVRQAILAAQTTFGTRIERILGAGGGLLVVLRHLEDEDDRLAAEIPGPVPVALIDPRTLSGLQRLGAVSPVANARTLVEAPAAGPAPEPRMLREARDKLQGAEVLIRQPCPGPAMDLLLSALLCAAAARAGRETPPTPREAGLWLLGEAVPQGSLTQNETALALRALALSQGADRVPEPLLRTLSAEVAAFVEASATRTPAVSLA